MKKINFIPISIIALALTTWSCNKPEIETMLPTENTEVSKLGVIIPNNFNFTTTKVINVNITAKGVNQKALSNTKVEIYEGNPYDNENCKALPIATIYTNNNGKATASTPIPIVAKKLYALLHTKGVQAVKEVNIDGINANFNFEAAQFSPPIASSFTSSLAKQKSSNIDNYFILNDFDTDGVPLNITHTSVDQSILDILNASLPERRPVPEYNPSYLAEGNLANVEFIDKAGKVYITFMHEGAGNLNSFGFYFYDTSTPPQSVNDITNIYVVFPNASFGNGGGGNLTTGDRIEITNHPLIAEHEGISDTIYPGTGLGWVLFRSSWRYEDVDVTRSKFYGNETFNYESGIDVSGKTNKIHVVELTDPVNEMNIIGFEDVFRDNESSDDDFNDIIFAVTANPYESIDNDETEEVKDPTTDCDLDGVPDIYDEYGNGSDGCNDPDDYKKAFNNYTTGTLAWEDLWPRKGDYDFNDLVANYTINEITNGNNKVTFIEFEIGLLGIGAGFKNGMAFELPIPPSYIKNVTGSVPNSGASYVVTSANGTEANQTNTVIFMFENAYDLTSSSDNRMVNVYPQLVHEDIQPIKIVVELNTPTTIAELGGAPYNPFIVKNQTRSYEIHLPGKLPTSLADENVFGGGDDNTIPGENKYYKTSDNLPWAIHMPVQFNHMIEMRMISTGYTKFAEWAQSGGADYGDWYQNSSGYINEENIYQPLSN